MASSSGRTISAGTADNTKRAAYEFSKRLKDELSEDSVLNKSFK